MTRLVCVRICVIVDVCLVIAFACAARVGASTIVIDVAFPSFKTSAIAVIAAVIVVLASFAAAVVVVLASFAASFAAAVIVVRASFWIQFAGEGANRRFGNVSALVLASFAGEPVVIVVARASFASESVVVVAIATIALTSFAAIATIATIASFATIATIALTSFAGATSENVWPRSPHVGSSESPACIRVEVRIAAEWCV